MKEELEHKLWKDFHDFQEVYYRCHELCQIESIQQLFDTILTLQKWLKSQKNDILIYLESLYETKQITKKEYEEWKAVYSRGKWIEVPSIIVRGELTGIINKLSENGKNENETSS